MFYAKGAYAYLITVSLPVAYFSTFGAHRGYRIRGFTLIELLVVIAIIGLLASVVLASLNSARTKARDAKRSADIKNVMLALELYYDSNGGSSYPGTCIGNGELTYLSSYLVPTYLSTIPLDPLYGNTINGYLYCYGPTQQSYTILINYEKKPTGVTTYCKKVSGQPENVSWAPYPYCP